MLPASNESLPSLGDRAAVQTQTRLARFNEGSAIRLRTHDGQLIQGSYDGHTSDRVRVAGDSSYLVPIRAIKEISERRPMTGPWLRRGLWLGAAVGAAFVTTVALTTEDCDADSCIPA